LQQVCDGDRFREGWVSLAADRKLHIFVPFLPGNNAGQEQNRDLFFNKRMRADTLKHFRPINIREHDIQQDQIRTLFNGPFNRRLSFRGYKDLKSLEFQLSFQDFQDFRIIVNNEDFFFPA